MGYSDQKFYTRNFEDVVLGSAVGTITASGSNSLVGVLRLPKFLRRTAINKIRVYVATAPAANLTVTKLAFLNGTNTFAVATIGTNTAGVSVDATVIATFGGVAASGTDLAVPLTTSTMPNGLTMVKEAGTNTNAIIAAGVQPTINAEGTGTASGQAVGTYDIWFEAQELHS